MIVARLLPDLVGQPRDVGMADDDDASLPHLLSERPIVTPYHILSVADRIADCDEHLVVGPGHPRHGWMAGYQLMFFRRLRYLWMVLASVVRRKRVGLRTTLKARADKKYYY